MNVKIEEISHNYDGGIDIEAILNKDSERSISITPEQLEQQVAWA